MQRRRDYFRPGPGPGPGLDKNPTGVEVVQENRVESYFDWSPLDEREKP